MREPVKFKWKGTHHGYIGVWFIGFGLFNWYMGMDNGCLSNVIPFWQSLVVIGTFCLVDDIIEHTICGNTPLRILFEKVIVPILKRKEK
jgi:uncharacterized membrane protein